MMGFLLMLSNVNLFIEKDIFPDQLKIAKVKKNALFKKDNNALRQRQLNFLLYRQLEKLAK